MFSSHHANEEAALQKRRGRVSARKGVPGCHTTEEGAPHGLRCSGKAPRRGGVQASMSAPPEIEDGFLVI